MTPCAARVRRGAVVLNPLEVKTMAESSPSEGVIPSGSGQQPAPFVSAPMQQQGDQQGGPSVPGWPAGLMGPAGGGHGQHQGGQQGGPSVPGWPAGLMGPGGPVGFFNQPGMMSGMMGMMPGLARFQGMQGGGHQAGAMQAGPGQNGASSKRGASDFGEAEGNEKARKAPRRSLAATMERMEKHKILERRRRERTKELVGELLAVIPEMSKLGESPTMNCVLEEAINFLKDTQWEEMQRRSHACKCGAPGWGGNSMPERPPHLKMARPTASQKDSSEVTQTTE